MASKIKATGRVASTYCKFAHNFSTLPIGLVLFSNAIVIGLVLACLESLI